MGRYFGTDGFRGEANVTLTADHAYKVGRFLGWYFNVKRPAGAPPARIVIAKDTRRSSYMFEYTLAAGITASGADAYLLHVTTTPSVAYVTRTEEFDCGVMISASHNPYYDNGIKLLNSQGERTIWTGSWSCSVPNTESSPLRPENGSVGPWTMFPDGTDMWDT